MFLVHSPRKSLGTITSCWWKECSCAKVDSRNLPNTSFANTPKVAAALGQYSVESKAACPLTCTWNHTTGISQLYLNIGFRVLKSAKFLNRVLYRRVDLLVKILIEDVAPYYEYLHNKIVSNKIQMKDTIF